GSPDAGSLCGREKGARPGPSVPVGLCVHCECSELRPAYFESREPRCLWKELTSPFVVAARIPSSLRLFNRSNLFHSTVVVAERSGARHRRDRRTRAAKRYRQTRYMGNWVDGRRSNHCIGLWFRSRITYLYRGDPLRAVCNSGQNSRGSGGREACRLERF